MNPEWGLLAICTSGREELLGQTAPVNSPAFVLKPGKLIDDHVVNLQTIYPFGID